MENNPRALFERLFGDGAVSPEARVARMQHERSLLDAVQEDARRLARELGAGDGRKLSEYLDAVRDVEQRIQRAEARGVQELPIGDAPQGIPETYAEHVKLMFDLQVLAYQADLTRVMTFMMAREVSNKPYPEIGVADPHHPLSHHQGDPEKLARMARINTFHASLFAHFVERLRTTPDGDGSLLDHVMLVYGSGMSESNQHLHDNLPILLVGGGGGSIKGNRHIVYPKGTPITNLYLTLLDKLGVAAERFGDSTGRVELLADV
jgi:hypothetical protein